MDIKKPKKILTREKRKRLQENILNLMDYGFTGAEIATNIEEDSPVITSVAKHGECFSISMEKTDRLLDKTDKLINSLK